MDFFFSMHFRMPTKGSTNTDFKLEFSSQLKHTKHELGSKAWQFEDTMEKHSIRLPLLLQVRAMYSTVQTQKYMFWVQKNKHLFFFFLFCFKLQRHPKNTQWTVPLCQRVKQRVYYTWGDCGGQGDTWQLANYCAGRNQHDTQVVPPAGPFRQLLELRCRRVFLLPSCSNGLLKSQCGSALFVFGCLLQIRSDCLGTRDCYCADAAILEVPLYNLVNFCYTFAPPPQGEKVWKNQVMQFVF